MINKISRVFIFQFYLIVCIGAQTSFQIDIKSETSLYSGMNTPFWAQVNSWGITTPKQSSLLNTIHFSSTTNLRKTGRIIFGVENAFVTSGDSLLTPELYIGISYKWFRILGGRKKTQLGENYFPLSLGSMIVGSNALPVPRISFSIPEYHLIRIKNITFNIKGGISNGWLDKGLYLKAPALHEKWLYLSSGNKDISGYIGLVHEAIWGGTTREFGAQPDSFEDYIRIFLLLSGPPSAATLDKTNTLGNHLGMWDLGFLIKKQSHDFHFYLQHPFEDQSGARWLLNYPDGLWGLAIHSKDKKGVVSDVLFELMYTMHQSGSEEVSDSTYGWDDYYNNYLYRGGWVYEGRVIGNPMFTLGQNEIRDWTHIVNNRVKALHAGFEGNITEFIQYRVLLTYSKNFGTFHDRDRSIKREIDYFFEDGLNQFSYRVDLKIKPLFKQNNLTATISFMGDKGELYENSKMILFGIEWDFSKGCILAR